MESNQHRYEELLNRLKELEKKAEFFQLIADYSYDWEVFRDKTGKIQYLNQAFERITGYKASDILSGKLVEKDIIHPDDWDLVRSKIVLSNQAIPVSNLEFRILTKSGEIRFVNLCAIPVHLNGEFIGTRTSVRDITEFKQIEELKKSRLEAEENAEKLRFLLDSLPVGVSILDENAELIFFNEELGNILKFNSSETRHKKYTFRKYLNSKWEEIHESEFPSYVALSKNISVFNYELAVLTEYNEIIWTNVSAIPVHYSDWRVVIVTQDITERKQIEQEYIRAKQKAEESDNLKSAFLNNMSHEVRTPLNAIVGFSKFMTKPNLSTEKQKAFSALITSSSEKLVGIITDVIEISHIHTKQSKVELAPVDFILFIRNLLSDYSVKASAKDIELILNQNIPKTEFFISTDLDKLKSILNHLLENALKFTSKGKIEVDCMLTGGLLKISVSDTGIGISEKAQKFIFEPFRQAESTVSRNFGGNGLGLAIVKAYTELLNGKIELKSSVNLGTTFTLTFPVIGAKSLPEIKMVGKSEKASKTILVVEDEYSNYQLLNELLSDNEFHVLYAPDGSQAIDLCRNNQTVDLILMDIKMPLMDGQTAAKLIKAFRPEMPIIAQTAYALENEMAQYSGDFDDYVTKPINEDELIKKISKYFAK